MHYQTQEPTREQEAVVYTVLHAAELANGDRLYDTRGLEGMLSKAMEGQGVLAAHFDARTTHLGNIARVMTRGDPFTTLGPDYREVKVNNATFLGTLATESKGLLSVEEVEACKDAGNKMRKYITK